MFQRIVSSRTIRSVGTVRGTLLIVVLVLIGSFVIRNIEEARMARTARDTLRVIPSALGPPALPPGTPRKVELYLQHLDSIEQQLGLLASEVTFNELLMPNPHTAEGTTRNLSQDFQNFSQHFQRTCGSIAQHCPQVRPLHAAYTEFLQTWIALVQAQPTVAQTGDPNAWSSPTFIIASQRHIEATRRVEQQRQLLCLGPAVR